MGWNIINIIDDNSSIDDITGWPTITGWWLKKHLEKYEFVNGKDDIPYMKWKIKAMFQTTNQIIDDIHRI